MPEEDSDNFELSQYIKFELRRGDENSAPASDLQFEVSIQKKEDTELFLKVEFEKPDMVSMGQR